ncbi:DNA topoisomerase IB [Ornithinimicrobium cryptoxanthini]|uniref:DNA topoisomerase n=1 Tax=Ornithinimicrobium cryptoxanthini TaxID=2934161 RepID=A0ABY4YF26_9MICO|nr:DNA topoisomerase IB [Ornithinimicrobium cryptoxanthini]USQ75367.1 DNA topoisomerase IB [Ornithinimicrobium cryptoxanthini]
MPRLRRADLDAPGITRRRRGRGFSYAGPTGRAVGAAVKERIDALAIPPAWRDVWISPDELTHIQAIGTDDAGRRQYIYHPGWSQKQADAKHDRVVAMARRLPTVRAQITKDLRSDGLTSERVLAGMLRMLDSGAFRTGGEAYAEEHDTHGVATLLREHVSVKGTAVRFSFVAKGGLDRDVTLKDKDLSELVKALRRARTGTDRLFCYRPAAGGDWREVHADDINTRFKELAGEECSVKDLRTWQATVRAALYLAEAQEPASDTERRRILREVMSRVADDLGNTPAVARGSYVDPRVVSAQESGRTIAAAIERVGSDNLDRPHVRAKLERAVIRLLSTS